MLCSSPALIFDLDGTLTDSKAGILGCLRKVLDERGVPYSGPLDRFIGPPVEKWVRELLPDGTNEEHVALAREYRACYDREGWSNNAVFPGIREMLVQLHTAGVPLYVCTSKHEHFAVRILDAFELSSFFVAVYGDKVEYASHSKVDLLARLLEDRSLARASTWMVGDRSFDIDAAHANRLRCLAAGWGYGSQEEWRQADAVAATPAEVYAVIAKESGAADLSPDAIPGLKAL
jgi:phosphoglycolate phosphatase